MKFVADFHIHSYYSRATSQEAVPEELYRWAVYKGVTLVGTGDFTHPAWRKELKEKLEPAEEGLYQLKKEFCPSLEVIGEPTYAPEWQSFLVRFIISGEISTIYKKAGRVRKIHHLILLPSLEAAEELSRRLEQLGNLESDGRPILGLDSRHLLELVLEVCREALFIPAHIWTPHFSLLGANSGFDSPEECFEDLTEYIYALETGLSSDPPMNWRLSGLDSFLLVSNSDAHSPRNLAREANLFQTDLSYPAIYRALKERDPEAFLGTIEFFPEEGKYHYDGHRACRVRFKPAETRTAGGICPVCGRRLTVGVLHRVEELADREEGVRPPDARPYQSLVPLPEVIASALGVGVSSKQVIQRYFSLLRHLGPELLILREAPLEEIARVAGPLVAEAVRRMREGEIEVQPGFDGEYGKIILLKPEERVGFSGQAILFDAKVVMEEGVEEEVSGASRKFGQEIKLESLQGEAPSEDLKGENGVTFSPSPLLADLNPQQVEAVTAEEGPVVVIAGPGTGKTRTLVYRLAYLLGEKKVPPGDIAAVTFTNKAAEEIKERIDELLKGIIGEKAFTVGTFHSICLDLLRQVYGLEFTLLDEVDVQEIWQEVLREKAPAGRQKAKRLKEEISLLKSRGLGPSSPGVPPELKPFYEAYQEKLVYYRALDYDDLLLETLRREEARAGQGQPSRFAYLLVDEFQDVNPVQYQLVRVWAGDGKNLFVIGDPDQAIYGFRGADHRFFFKLQEEFPQAKVIRLVLNYRSTPTVLKAACGLLKQENPQLVATRGDGPRILYLEVPSEIAEGIAVVREIERLVGGATMLQAHGQCAAVGQDGVEIGDKSYSFSDIAVLFRSSRELKALEECFLKEGIPYRVIGRESFLEDPQVREAIDFFRCVNSPEDDFHLYRSLRRMGVKGEYLACLLEMAQHTGSSLWEFIGELVEGKGHYLGSVSREALTLPPETLPRLRHFRETLLIYRALANTQPAAELLARWEEERGLHRSESLERLLRVAARFNNLPSFLRGITLAQEADHERLGGQALTSEFVSLMTLHAAKGLEFPVVFITGVDEGIIPFAGQDGEEEIPMGQDLPREGSEFLEKLEEERRLFYVGITRAKEVLILLSARARTLYGRKILFQPSRFLQDIPPDCLKKKIWKDERRKKEAREEGWEQLSLFTR